MFQVQIKTNGVVHVVSVEANSKNEAIAKAKNANPKSKYLMCYEGNPPVTKHPIGPPMDEILSKLNKRKVENGTNN